MDFWLKYSKIQIGEGIALKDAIKTNVKDGCHLSIGGFTINRNPMAAIYEIIRQKIKQLHLYAHSNIMGFDRTTKKMYLKGYSPGITADMISKF